MGTRIYPSVIAQKQPDVELVIKVYNRKNSTVHIECNIETSDVQQTILQMFTETVTPRVVEALQDIIYD